MVIFGDDSLNEKSEDSAPTENLDTLRMKLGKKKEEVKPEDSEPSDAQLIATGEMDEGLEESDGVQPNEPSTQGSTALIVTEEAKLSIRKQVRKRLLEGATRDELLTEGFNKSTISTVASEVKKEMGTRTPIGKAPLTTQKGLPIFAKGSPPEAIIDSIEIPDVTDGQGVSFEQGIKFGMSLLVLSTRLVQELAGIGVTQAKPILDMAKSMREGEALASKNAAGEAAMEAAGMVEQSLMPILSNLQRNNGAGEGKDPMRSMMARTMEPIMQKMMGNMLGRLIPGAPQKQLTEGTGEAGGAGIDGWVRKSE